MLKISKHYQLSLDNLTEKPQLEAIKQKLATRNQGWLDIDTAIDLEKIEQVASKLKNKFQSIVILGIGGSALGVTATLKALKHLYTNELATKTIPKLYILDNITPEFITETLEAIDLQQTLFIVTTKSGTTPETLAQYFYFRELLNAKIGNEEAKQHFIFITDPSKGTLRQIATTEQIESFEIPSNIGGRFSVLTAVGLVPMALMGVDIRAMINGFKQAQADFQTQNTTDNQAFDLAYQQYQNYTEGKRNINVLMPYNNKLFSFSDWYRQLLAESIGKAVDLDGNEVHIGITPVNALGVTDQHSQVQLYTEGPDDKLFIILKTKENHPNEQQQIIKTTDENFQFINNITFKKLLDTEMDATISALVKYKKPVTEIVIDKLTAESLGYLYMFFMLSVGVLGELLNINTYDQPGVELGKILTKENLI
jgi:glucose-6-phosphate isomerase